MTKSKHTMRALLVSVLSVLLCLSMLVGSTFAWFTDSVTSGRNKIVAGNLDVELEYTTTPEIAASWTAVGAETNLFQPTDGENATLWEPGHTEVVYLRVHNAGSLALKYQFSVNVFGDENGGAEKEYTNMSNGKFKLSNYLVFTQKDGASKVASRNELWLPADEEQAAMGDLSRLDKENTQLLPGASDELTLAVYMPTQVGNEANQLTSAKETEGKPTIYLGLTLLATQTPHEADSFDNTYDAAAEYAKPVDNKEDFMEALEKGDDIKLVEDIQLTGTGELFVRQDSVIDLNGHKITGEEGRSAVSAMDDANVVIKNGTIEANPLPSGAVLYAEGAATVTVENCTITSKGNKSFAVCTNGSKSKNASIVIRNSTISAPTADGAKGYALYAPAGNVSFIDCDVTGHVFISGGNVTLDGGTYTATGFNNQSKIWHKADTISYVSGMAGGTANTMGDSILIADRRAGYTLSGVTIRNITFNTAIPAGTSYAIKYVDMNRNGAESRVNYVIENNTFNQQIDGKDPVMYIDLAGNDLANP